MADVLKVKQDDPAGRLEAAMGAAMGAARGAAREAATCSRATGNGFCGNRKLFPPTCGTAGIFSKTLKIIISDKVIKIMKHYLQEEQEEEDDNL